MTAGRQRGWCRLGLLFSLIVAGCSTAPSSQLMEDFRSTLALQATDAQADDSQTVSGSEGWLFSVPELLHVSSGQFWSDDRNAMESTSDGTNGDPLTVILDFKDQLSSLGVELLLVPVPPKVLIFADKVQTSQLALPVPPPRLDQFHIEFYALLRDADVDVLDLTETFIRERFRMESPLYCRTDTHWSSSGCVVAARQIAETIRERNWFSSLESTPESYHSQWLSSSIHGNLTSERMELIDREEIQLRAVSRESQTGLENVSTNPDSPIILLGDSHSLVFHTGGSMHATGSGLADQLAAELGLSVDLVAVEGPSAAASREELLKRARDDSTYWQKKHLVIWCFSALEFTNSDEWSLLPINSALF